MRMEMDRDPVDSRIEKAFIQMRKHFLSFHRQFNVYKNDNLGVSKYYSLTFLTLRPAKFKVASRKFNIGYGQL